MGTRLRKGGIVKTLKSLHYLINDSPGPRADYKSVTNGKDHSFSTYINFTEKLTFLTPRYTDVRVRNKR